MQQGLAVIAQFGRGHLTDTLDTALGAGNARNAGTLVRQQELGAGPALVLVIDTVLDRHLDVLEPNLVDLMLAAQGDDRAHGDAGGLHIDQQEGDAFLDLGVRVGTDQTEDPVGILRHRGPAGSVKRSALVFNEARSEPAPGSE